ncbi:Scr1 family TA system antitoxin-like transcriptional regulator [Streptomyces sp. 8ZJF_21]|uniref:Scr1 family TA system antitoxin-like transcriptional regulator n=1 Tax=Streptomyces sp. 8ZJF_21 TaxID=2903141 RepID=UPI001E505843|nr:Scr1 family TA system antitoxin-like transcriptional regulator [Streptomyces sp. 8ZJF_21]MCD9592737.1 DUF5753 domain-containing protein [Streptomyces sp. 8ZJF_21]
MLDYSTNALIGILQTNGYARAVFRSYFSREEDAVIEGKVAVRLRRHEAFELEAPPFLWGILNEACLRAVVGGPEAMAGHLEYLRGQPPHRTSNSGFCRSRREL